MKKKNNQEKKQISFEIVKTEKLNDGDYVLEVSGAIGVIKRGKTFFHEHKFVRIHFIECPYGEVKLRSKSFFDHEGAMVMRLKIPFKRERYCF